MKEDCPPSSHVPISDSKSILKSELLSLLKTYNCYHEGRSFQLRHREMPLGTGVAWMWGPRAVGPLWAHGVRSWPLNLPKIMAPRHHPALHPTAEIPLGGGRKKGL
uniref:Ras association domain family member 4 n=1 Tax=Sus scrofa TaxID=9823 RepID=A0A8D0W8J4_PIG